MKARFSKDQTTMNTFPKRLATVTLLALTAALSFGCSSDLASIDDTYVPASVDENFPIRVVEKPVKLKLDVADGRLYPADVSEVAAFGRQAALRASTPVTVAYSAGSSMARQGAGHAAEILARQGLARQFILITPHDGKESSITLAYATKATETKPCGDWSENMRANQFNESGPNFGCAFQKNVAAMIASPEDLRTPRSMTPAASAAQTSALTGYYTGRWTTPIQDSTLQTSQ
ncbi:CpaD family pilus assembly lipoprotein [Aestuariivirga sp.]|uniref:CpaD family pilus assembly protein n=1 Tax=Aestuariivirga sp. TaxID=2650926 RepID=UPI0030186C00